MAFMLWLSIVFGLLACGDFEKKNDGESDEKTSKPAPEPLPTPLPSPGPGGSNPFPLPPGGGDNPNPFPNPCDSLPFPVPSCPTSPSPNPPSQPAPQPPSNPPSAPGEGNIGEKETFLRFHNLKRCWHSAPAITWNQQLADEARAYASACRFAHDPNNGGRFGENLAIGYPDIIKSQDAWYMEYLQYDFQRGGFSPATGHFTQMVWIGSSELGCARVQCPQGPYDICRYKPAGNVIGQFQQNVKPLRDDISQCGL